MSSVPASATSIQGEREGNTRPLSQNRGARVINPAKYWCFTIFNFEESWKGDIVPLLDNVFEYCIGLEICEKTQNRHLQGYVSFKKKYRPLTSWNKVFQGIHFEKCKGTREQNYKYCSKEGNFITNMSMLYPVSVQGMIDYCSEGEFGVAHATQQQFELRIFHGIYKFKKFKVCENCRPDILKTKINEAYLRIYGDFKDYPTWWDRDTIHNYRMYNEPEYFEMQQRIRRRRIAQIRHLDPTLRYHSNDDTDEE